MLAPDEPVDRSVDDRLVGGEHRSIEVHDGTFVDRDLHELAGSQEVACGGGLKPPYILYLSRSNSR
jgi:hypothetical protein